MLVNYYQLPITYCLLPITYYQKTVGFGIFELTLINHRLFHPHHLLPPPRNPHQCHTDLRHW
jgi:hypothetical protein